MDKLNNTRMILILFCLWISYTKSTSLPVRSRQVLYYPSTTAGLGLQQIVPQSSELSRIDINQRSPLVQRLQNPHDLYLLYPNNLPVPGEAQSPSYNEIFPTVNVQPTLNPNAVLIPKQNGEDPDIEPDAVLIPNVRSQQPNIFSNQFPPQASQPFPPRAATIPGLAPFNFNVFRLNPNSGPARPNPNAETDAELIPEAQQRPEKLKAGNLELLDEDVSKTENPDKSNTAGEQEVLAAADKNPNLPQFPSKSGRDPQLNSEFPTIKPGQRFFILNGQPQFFTYPPLAAPNYPQLPVEQFLQGNPQNLFFQNPNGNPGIQGNQNPDVQVFDPNNFQAGRLTAEAQPNNLLLPQSLNPFGVAPFQNIKLAEPQALQAQNRQKLQKVPVEKDNKEELSEQKTNEFDSRNPAKLMEAKENIANQPEQQYIRSRQVFGAPYFLRTRTLPNSDIRNLASGPNAENLKQINPQQTPQEQTPSLEKQNQTVGTRQLSSHDYARCENITTPKIIHKKRKGRTSSYVHIGQMPSLSSTTKIILFSVLYFGTCITMKRH